MQVNSNDLRNDIVSVTMVSVAAVSVVPGYTSW